MRPRIGDARAYVAPYTFGEAMSGGAVGRVAVSRHPGFAEGDWVLHMLGWRVGAIRRAPIGVAGPRTRPRSLCSGDTPRSATH